MARVNFNKRINNTNRRQEAAPEVFDGQVKLSRCHWFDANSVSFSLDLVGLGITLHGLRIVYPQDTSKAPFIAPPARKGNDGNYYSHYFIRFASDLEADIIKMVEAEMPDDADMTR